MHCYDELLSDGKQQALRLCEHLTDIKCIGLVSVEFENNMLIVFLQSTVWKGKENCPCPDRFESFTVRAKFI